MKRTAADREGPLHHAGDWRGEHAAGDAPRNTMSFLIWRTIEIMASRTKVFDFEGSMEPGVEEYYRSFGPQKVNMLQLSRCWVPFMKI